MKVVHPLLRCRLGKSRALLCVSQDVICHWMILLTSIRVKNLLVVEQAAIAGQEKDCGCHIAVVAASAGRVADLCGKLRLVLLIALAGRHLRWEDARCNGVNADLAVLKRCCKHTANVGESRLRGGVGELAIARSLHLAADGADVDDLGRVARGDISALGEERQHGHGHEVLTSDIGLGSLRPLGVL